MINILLHGALGRMGRAIAEFAAGDPELQICCGVDAFANGAENPGFPLYASLEECRGQADVVVDFSTASAVDGLLDFCAERKLPCVLCTTGLSDEQLAGVRAASEKTAILRSANMSLGINLLCR